MISAIILAAGESKRFGSPKQLARLNNSQTLVGQLISTLKKTNINEIVIVLGAYINEIKKKLPGGVIICENKNYQRGQTSSLKVGLQNLSAKSNYFLVFPVDIPAILAETINYIIEKFKDSKSEIGVPQFKGKKGHPPIYDIKLKDEILKLKDDEPLYLINQKFPGQTLLIDVNDPAIIANINTPQDLEKICDYSR